MRDQHHCGTTVFANGFQQRDDLRLNRHVQCGGGLVGHDQLRLGGQRQGNHHPLAHTARKLVWKVVNALLGRRDAGVFQQVDGALARFSLAHRQVGGDGFNELAAHRVQRVQRGERVLKNGANLAPAHLAHLFIGQVVDTLAVQAYLATGHAARWLQQANNGCPGKRLARTRFTHHTQNFTGCDIERNVVQRAQRAAATRKFDHEIFYF